MKKYILAEAKTSLKNPANVDKRVCEYQNSILTELLEIKHFRTIRHFFYALLVVFIIRDVLAVSTERQYTFGFKMLIKGFQNIHLGFLLWASMFIFHIAVFIVFSFWSKLRQEFVYSDLGYVQDEQNKYSERQKNRSTQQPSDLILLTLLVMYYAGSIYFIPLFTHRINLAPIISTIVQLENLRLVMKSHSFVRSSISKVLHTKANSDQLEIPTFSHFLYFSFAPTLLYKKEYSRRKNINFHLALKYFIDLLCCIWLLGFITDNTIPNLHKDAGLTKIYWTNIALSVFDTFLVGLFVFLALFYMIYQCWLNITGELLLFGNRKFYQEWWTAPNYAEFFRTWNSIVQDWLYIYVYREFKENITPNSNLIPKLMVLFISGLVHEYVLSCVLQQFFPTMFIFFFVIAAPLTFLSTEHPFFNVYFIMGLGLWSSGIINFSILEYNAKINCPLLENETFLRYLPRAITADCFDNTR